MTVNPDDSLLPDTTNDEASVGWGDTSERDDSSERDDWYQRERPPHHGD